MFEYPEVAYCISEAVFSISKCHINSVVTIRHGHIQFCNTIINSSVINEFTVNVDGYISFSINWDINNDCSV